MARIMLRVWSLGVGILYDSGADSCGAQFRFVRISGLVYVLVSRVGHWLYGIREWDGSALGPWSIIRERCFVAE